MKVCFETFGCRLNRAEALQMEAEYLARGWELTDSHSDADLIVVRGCSVTRRAQRDCEKFIAHLKKKHPLVPLRICGCIANKRDDGKALESKVEEPEGSSVQAGNENQKVPEQPVPTRTARAYLKCQDGCSGKCTFCIVPQFRGSSVSIPFADLLDEARRFIDAGYHEIVLTGCNLALYASQGKHFPDLVAALAELTLPHSLSHIPHPSSCRIRIGSLEPGDCAREAVEVMAGHANVCRFLHIPVQSGSNKILKAMGRPYQLQDVDSLVREAVAKMPLIGLGCDMMCGFPGETVVEHQASLGLLKRLPFSNAHVFPFSERPGTLAAGLPDAIAREIRHARARELSDITQRTRARTAKKFVGKDVDVLIEDETKLAGWTGEYFACEIKKRPYVLPKRKEIVRVRVTNAVGDRLKAEPL